MGSGQNEDVFTNYLGLKAAFRMTCSPVLAKRISLAHHTPVTGLTELQQVSCHLICCPYHFN
jgi:hypothetical protein